MANLGGIPNEIIDGPSNWDLMLSLFEGKKIEFELNGKVTTTVRINALSNMRREKTIPIEGVAPKSADVWLIAGRIAQGPGEYVVYIAYSSAIRKGLLECVELAELQESDQPLLDEVWGDRILGGDGWRKQ